MPEKNDFTWGKGRVVASGSLGKIVTIPPASGIANGPEENEPDIIREAGADYVVDEFKEKVAEALSKELHKKQA